MNMSSARVAVVTGSNKGIGFGIVREMCKQFEGVVYLTARDEARGKAAVEKLEQENLSPRFHQLDIDSQESIDRLRDYVQKTYGGLDILINNAGMAYKFNATEPFGEQATNTFRVNFFGTRALCHALFPLLRHHARIVNVSSSVGFLGNIRGTSPAAVDLKSKLASSDLTEDSLCDLMKEFVNSACDGTYAAKGWPGTTYAVSKIGVSALSRIQQREFDRNQPDMDIIVNHLHPGYVVTDMTSQRGAMTVEQASTTPVWLALLPPNVKSPRGDYIWHNKKIVDWVNGPLP